MLHQAPHDVRQIDHPFGRFERADGKRFDVCIMDIRSDPEIFLPYAGCFGILEGERAATRDERITIGQPSSYWRMSQSRPLLATRAVFLHP
jgi:hypothetical protein